MSTPISTRSRIAVCGNDCGKCPRHASRTDEELAEAARLWHRVGLRDRELAVDEIRCGGCRPGRPCPHGVVDCAAEQGVDSCGLCENYPCRTIQEAFDRTATFTPRCLAACTSGEFAALHAAFFRKQENLDAVADARWIR